jgi:hypothetical protein
MIEHNQKVQSAMGLLPQFLLDMWFPITPEGIADQLGSALMGMVCPIDAGMPAFTTMIDEGGSKLIQVTTKDGKILEVMFDEVIDGSTLILRKTHVDGLKPGELGIKNLMDLVRTYGKQRGFTKVIVEGARRSTGRMKGKVPRPWIIPIE